MLILAEDNRTISRSELKYYIPSEKLTGFLDGLSKIMELDPHCNSLYEGYRINSVYLDSNNRQCLQDKLDGVLFRKKFRLRRYENSSKCYFEVKSKFGSRSIKQGFSLNKTELKKFQKQRFEEVKFLEKNGISDQLVSGSYSEVVSIDYRRIAFRSDFFNIRVTVDYSMACDFNNLSGDLSSYAIIPLLFDDRAIVEIKFDKYVPTSLRKYFENCGFLIRTSFSKYCYAMRFERLNTWNDY